MAPRGCKPSPSPPKDAPHHLPGQLVGEDLWVLGRGEQGMLPEPPALRCCCGDVLGHWAWGQRGVALGERGGQAGVGGRQALSAPCLRSACALCFPPPSPVQKSLLCCWGFFPPFNS